MIGEQTHEGNTTAGPGTVRTWAERLNDADETACLCARHELVRNGLDLASAVPELASSLRRGDASARAQGVEELGRLGVRLQAVIPRLRDALRAVVLTDGEEAVRTNALHALRLIEPTSTSQVPALVEALRDKLPAVRAAAAQDLAQLGPQAREGVAALIRSCVHDSDLAVRVHAGAALWHISRQLLPAIPALMEGLRSGDEVLCWNAADCLGEMGVEAAPAVPALLEAAARYSRPLIHTSIVLALERIDPKAASTVTIS